MADKSQTFKFTGTVTEVGQTEIRSEKFKTRRFVLTEGGEYPQFIEFQAVNERCDALETVHAGDTVTVSFDLRGRMWNEKAITNLNAWRIEKHGATQNPLPPAEARSNAVGYETAAANTDGLPF